MYTSGIEAFLAVIRARSLSKAADELNLAQTTVSQRLKVLEREIGMTLIERGKGIKQIGLTPYGEEFLQLAERWNLLMQEAKVLQLQGPHMSLKVGSVDSVNTFVLPQVYHAMTQNDLPIRLETRTSHSVDLYSEVERRQVDIAFVLRHLSHPNVSVTKYFSTPMVVLRLTSSAGRETKTIHPSALAAEHELYMPWGHDHFRPWHDYWWPPLIPARIKLDSAHLLLSLLQNPDRWAIVPVWIANEALKRGNYSIFRLADRPPDYTCYKLTHMNPTSLTMKALETFDYHFRTVNASLFLPASITRIEPIKETSFL